MRSERQPLSRAERLDLREREVLGEPAGDRLAVDGLRALAIGKPIGDVGRAADLVLVPRDQHAVLRRDEVRLDEVGAHLDGEPVALERVLGPMAARAAVADDDRRGRRDGCRRAQRQQPAIDVTALPQQLEPELQLARIVGRRDRAERAGAAVAVRRAEVRAVEQVERLEPELELAPARRARTCFDAARSNCQKFGPRTVLRSALPNGWLGSVGTTTQALLNQLLIVLLVPLAHRIAA